MIVTLLAASSDDATARRRRHAHKTSYNPPYAAIVVDANSGTVLHSSNADALRHPASLTKIMTLYLLFEQLDAGKLKLESPLDVSAHAANQSPTKLGLRTGSVLKVEEAIKGMVTRSANDAAVVVAENLGGSEEQFAALMTRKAHELGMSKTVYRNASGLPNDEQVTTARDQSMLGRAIQERFPRYYRYFQIRSFTFHGESIGNHNRLLGQVEGVDGIKTGFTSASGFNLVTSVHRDNRYVVAVVLGGASAGSRDARMRDLIKQHIASASTKRTAPIVAEATPAPVAARAAVAEPAPVAARAVIAEPVPAAVPVRAAVAEPATNTEGKDPQRFNLASASTAPLRADPPITAAVSRAMPGSTDPIRPVMVKTLNIKPSGGVRTASIVPMQFAGLPRPSGPPSAEALAAASAKAEPPARANTRGVTVTPAPAAAPLKPSPRGGWVIQVGAYPDENDAKQRLAAVKSKGADLLATADPITESVSKGGTTYYRARFAGLGKEQAEAACKYLKRNDVDCLPIKN